MADAPLTSRLDELILDIDLLVYALERPAPADPEAAQQQRDRLRRDLERARDALRDLLRSV